MPTRIQRVQTAPSGPPPRVESPILLPANQQYASRVLIAEDDPESRATLAAGLRAIGYEVSAVATGGELVDRLAARALYDPSLGYDLVISGVAVPEFAGLALLDDLRLMGWRSPVILIVEADDLRSKQEATNLLDVHLIERPFAIGDFLGLVRRTVPPRQPRAFEGTRLNREPSPLLGAD